MHAALELIGVSKRFKSARNGRIRAVDDMHLLVHEGELLTLLGPSGCGKTTTLRLIIGLERCDAGQIVAAGRVVDAPHQRIYVPTHKRQMGMVFQSYAIWPHMTVYDNVAYPLRVRGIGGQSRDDAVHRVLDLVGLSGFAHRPATQLSGGQQQRVALARSLVFEPKLLLLDEPFSNLDAQLRSRMRAELKLLQRRLGLTVVLVTHDQVEALSVSDRIAVMRAGRIEQLDSPQAVYRSPASPAVRDFVGRTLLLQGVICGVTDEAVVVRVGAGAEVVCARGAPDGHEIHDSPAVRDAQAVQAIQAIQAIQDVQDVRAVQVGQAAQLAMRPEHAVVTAAESAHTPTPDSAHTPMPEHASATASATAPMSRIETAHTTNTMNTTNTTNCLPGRIRALLFLGDRYEATLALDSGQEAFVYLPATHPWREGQPVTLHLPPHHLRLWPTDSQLERARREELR